MGEGGEGTLGEEEVAGSWLVQFEAWMEDARRSGMDEPEAMVLGTADAAGRPSARTVLLKGLDERGFEFFSNEESRKGRELAENPRASLVFPWYGLRRQVTVTGSVTATSPERADEYFATRAYGSKIGALVSRQSRVIADRGALERELAEVRRRHPEGAGEVPRPVRWRGFRVEPDSVEFWQGRRDRLHDRLRFRLLPDGSWTLERLSP